MKRIVVIFVLLAWPIAAQEPKKETERPAAPATQKLFILKYADPLQLRGLLAGFNAQINLNREMRALSVTGSPEAVAAVEEALQRLDVPAAAPRNLELAVWLLVGGEEEGVSGQALPKELDSVVSQLKGSFAFKSYRLLDALNLRTRTGQGAAATSAGGVVQVHGASQTVLSSFKVRSTAIGGDGAIRIDGLQAHCSNINLDLNTDVDIREGQKLVVGRMGIGPAQALFLVLTAHVVQ